MNAKISPFTRNLIAYGGSQINILGETSLSIQYGKESLDYNFVVVRGHHVICLEEIYLQNSIFLLFTEMLQLIRLVLMFSVNISRN